MVRLLGGKHSLNVTGFAEYSWFAKDFKILQDEKWYILIKHYLIYSIINFSFVSKLKDGVVRKKCLFVAPNEAATGF